MTHRSDVENNADASSRSPLKPMTENLPYVVVRLCFGNKKEYMGRVATKAEFEDVRRFSGFRPEDIALEEWGMRQESGKPEFSLYAPTPKILVVATTLVPVEGMDDEDVHALGVWEFSLKASCADKVKPAQYVDAALDCYHSQVAIDSLDDFEFEVFVDGVLTPRLDDHEDYSLKDVGDVDFISNDPLEIQDLHEGRPFGLDRIPELADASYEAMDAWFAKMVEADLFFNPDDPAESIVSVATGKPFFSRSECVKLDGIIQGLFAGHPSSLHDCALTHMRRAMGMPTKPVSNDDPGPAM